MNYWHRWIGSIQKKTAQLSLAEMGAYDRLLDHYYAQEKPLPGDSERCYRIAGAATKDERKAVDAVLAEFFALTPEGYAQERADSEIAKAEPKLAAARSNGVKGGRPRKAQDEPKKNPKTTQRKPSGLSEETQSETSTTTTKTLTPIPSGCPPLPDGMDSQVWADWLALRKAKRAPVTATTLGEAESEAVKAGMSLEAFLRIWCARGSQGLSADWLKPNERQQATGETVFQKSRRDNVAAFTGGLAARRITKPAGETIDAIDAKQLPALG